MSIIQEALKKIEVPERVSPPPRAATPPVPPAARAREAAIVRSTAESRTRVATPARREFVWMIPLIVAAVAALTALVIVVAVLVGSASRRKADPVVPAVKTDDPVSADAAVRHQEAIYKTIEPASAAERLSPRTVVRTEPPDLMLGGIMYLENGKRAIINNVIVSEGDMVAGATVGAINKKSVILTYNNVEITLNLK